MLSSIVKVANSVFRNLGIRIQSRLKKKDRILFANNFKSDCTSFLSCSDIEKIKCDAKRILDGELQVFNFRPYRNVKWNQDPVSRRIVHNSVVVDLIRVSQLYNSADIKNIWDQSHLYSLVTLAQCYVLTSDSHYADSIVDTLISFYDCNPCGQSIAWKCSMDSAIRLANIVLSVSKITNSIRYKKEEKIIVKYIYQHVLFISRNYEDKGECPNNHYISDLVGVIWGAVYLYQNYKIEKAFSIYSESINRLENEINRQVRNDGFDFELSTYYHCFVAELLAETINMLSQNNFTIPISIIDTTKKMIGCCAILGAFDGQLPLLGDQDGSRLFLLRGYFDVDRCDFSVLQRFADNIEYESNRIGNICILNGGGIRAYFKCGAIGTEERGTHDHNDQLSVCVYVGDVEIICDSGTYCYTNNLEARKKYRSVKSHSTVFFPNLEQNDISNVFSFGSRNDGRLVRQSSNFAEGVFTYENNLFHRRVININSGCLTIEDTADNGIARLVIPYPCSLIRKVNDYHVCFSVQGIHVNISSNESIEIHEASISKAYGIESEATYVDSPCIGRHFYYIQQGDLIGK